MRETIAYSVQEAIRAAETLKEATPFMERVAEMLLACFARGGKVLLAGNGGSLCDAMHFAEELTGFYRSRRRPLPAIALADTGHMSCVANDTTFDHVFSRPVEALGQEGDLLILLSTSGNSRNLIEAAKAAHQKSMHVIAFLGKTGGMLQEFCDDCWIVRGFPYSDRIQEAHMAAIHIIIEAVECRLLAPAISVS